MSSDKNMDDIATAIEQDVSLQTLTTMALPARAAYFCRAENEAQICAALCFAKQQQLPLCLLGGGSNLIFRGDFPGLVLHLANRGIAILAEDADSVTVKVAAGEIWDEFLQYCLQQGWYGLENLAIIPGTVGAAPVQNIGAYGQEAGNCIAAVNGFVVDGAVSQRYEADACHFAYRESVFKRELAGRFVISSVEFRLHKQFTPCINYQPLAEYFAHQTQIMPEDVRRAVINIRESKLPDPKKLANAGSFFKNPVVSNQQYQELLKQFPRLPAYPATHGQMKLAAGWLIEQCGWKGKQLGAVGMYAKQALVLVNHGGAVYADVKQLVDVVKQSVFDKFQVTLEQEPVLV